MAKTIWPEHPAAGLECASEFSLWLTQGAEMAGSVNVVEGVVKMRHVLAAIASKHAKILIIAEMKNAALDDKSSAALRMRE
jgi:uncharacterized protein YcbX